MMERHITLEAAHGGVCALSLPGKTGQKVKLSDAKITLTDAIAQFASATQTFKKDSTTIGTILFGASGAQGKEGGSYTPDPTNGDAYLTVGTHVLSITFSCNGGTGTVQLDLLFQDVASAD